mmetsp:Transcript_37434/g.49222  ORF Transcript_37434/g.49222 Transcript_37434/m.49222 type:complete len:91 (-) Transcript_37434:456-728(-)
MSLATEYERARLSVEYSLVAQFVPRESQFFTNDKMNLSSFSSTIPLYVMRPQVQTAALMVDKPFSLNSQIGGCCGGCTKPCSSQIFFQKN